MEHIDTKTHESALTKGKTVAVLVWPDIAYPPENKQLFKKMAQNGAVISEYPLGTLPGQVISQQEIVLLLDYLKEF